MRWIGLSRVLDMLWDYGPTNPGIAQPVARNDERTSFTTLYLLLFIFSLY